ncbi:MAG: MazG nucleotide pyrophosphohydrolase domain-containing protein [Candidatus Promineifilaceae bacterium]
MNNNQTDPLRDLAQSTYDFFDRFDVSPKPENASKNFLEEVNELLDAVELGENQTHIAEEAADVFVTVIGLCASVGVTIDDLVSQAYRVIDKNDAKNHETHIHLDGKIRRRSSKQ